MVIKMTIYRLSDMRAVDSVPAGYAVALGAFDGVHRGHAEVISAARRLGHGRAAVWTMSSDDSFFKGKERITDDTTKLRLLRDAGADYAAVSDFESVRNMSGEEFFRKILIDILRVSAVVCGRDFRFGKSAASGCAELAIMCHDAGVGFIEVSDVTFDGASISSTRIRELIQAGNVAEAAKLLGRPFTLRAPVSFGKQFGHTLGYPTANQLLPPSVVSPARGVYATIVNIIPENPLPNADNTANTAAFDRPESEVRSTEIMLFPGASNVGVCPTVSDPANGASAICETHILGYSGDLYGAVIEVAFLCRLRGEIKFASVSELKDQIAYDSLEAEKIALRCLNEINRR